MRIRKLRRVRIKRIEEEEPPPPKTRESLFIRLLMLFTVDLFGYRCFQKKQYRSGLLYILTMGGLFSLFPMLDFVNEYVPLPRLMFIKRKLLSFYVLAMSHQFITNMTVRWVAIYMLTGEFKRTEYERLRLIGSVLICVVFAGELQWYDWMTTDYMSHTASLILTLYNTELPDLTISLDWFNTAWRMVTSFKIGVVYYVNYQVFSYFLKDPLYLPMFLAYDYSYVPREDWTETDFQNVAIIALIQESMIVYLASVYTRYFLPLLNTLTNYVVS